MFDSLLVKVLVAGYLYWRVYKSFAHFDDVGRPEKKKLLAAWLMRADPHSASARWPEQFLGMFDRLFGESHLSVKCFLRSFLVTFIVLTVLFALWAIARPEGAVRYAKFINEDLADRLPFFLVFNVMWNMIFDYTSLLACRYILGIMESRAVTLLASLGYALLATVASATTYIFVTLYVGLIAAPILWDHTLDFTIADVNAEFVRHLQELWAKGLALRSPPGVFFYSALFVSAWAWLYVGATGCVRLFARLNPVLHFLREYMNIEEKPLSCIGVVAGAMAAAGCFAFLLLT